MNICWENVMIVMNIIKIGKRKRIKFKIMTQEKFKSLIEVPYNYEDRTFAKYAVARTVRLVLENIDLAKEWYNNLPKAVMDNEKIPTI